MRISDWSSDVCSSDLLGHKDVDGGILLHLIAPAHIDHLARRSAELHKLAIHAARSADLEVASRRKSGGAPGRGRVAAGGEALCHPNHANYLRDRKSTRLNYSH